MIDHKEVACDCENDEGDEEIGPVEWNEEGFWKLKGFDYDNAKDNDSTGEGLSGASAYVCADDYAI